MPRSRSPPQSFIGLDISIFDKPNYAGTLAQIEAMEKYRRQVEKQEKFARLRKSGPDAKTLVSMS